MRSNREYIICREIAAYMRLRYPSVPFHFDLSGQNLSKAQAGMMKMLQCGRGWPDLFIAEQSIFKDISGTPVENYKGLFVEVKKEGTKIFNSKKKPATPHIAEQIEMMEWLERQGYKARFAVGFDEVKKIIDSYLSLI